jgi:hypothetical protein
VVLEDPFRNDMKGLEPRIKAGRVPNDKPNHHGRCDPLIEACATANARFLRQETNLRLRVIWKIAMPDYLRVEIGGVLGIRGGELITSYKA